jgi:small subunit ribosomal protein S3
MGQKVNPHAMRLGSLYNWKSRWFSDDKNYRQFLLESIKLRRFLMRKLRSAGIFKVDIERFPKSIKIILYVSRPGVVIGRGGANLEELKKLIVKKLETGLKIELEIEEVRDPDINAQLVLDNVVSQLERRIRRRQVVNRAMEKVMDAGAKGIKIVLAGRIAGAEISRTEKYSRGRLPLQTIRADIDYAARPALTKSGFIGVKVWIYKGEKEI